MGDVFKNGVEDRYPKELLDKRAIYEGNVIGCLWREPKIYYDDWKLNIEDFLTIDGMAFFKLGKDLYSAGFTTLDESSIITYMADKPKLEEWFENKGGYKAIQGLMDFVNMDNADAYLDNLNKSNILLNLFNNGFDVVNHLDTFEKMPSDMVYQWYDFKLNNLFVKKQIGIKIEDLVIDDGFLKETNAGNAMGISYSDKCPILSYSTLGIHKKNLMLIAGHSGTGKAQPLNAKILTPNGYRTMGDMKIGSQVMGDDGLPHTVIGVFPQGKKKIYKITFSDGTTTECCDEHLWTIQNPNQRRNGKFVTKELKDIIKQPLYKKGKDGCKEWQVYIPMTKPLQFDKKHVFMNPYKFGCLIGSIGERFGDTPLDIIDRMDGYLINDIDIRIKFLQGLCDHYGDIKEDYIEYTTNSKQLSQNIIFLVQSLGGTCEDRLVNNCENTVTHKLIIKMPKNIIPFKAHINLDKYKINEISVQRAIVDIQYVGMKECQCIYINSDSHLYLTNDMIVTHNTSFISANIMLPLLKQGKKFCVISNEQNINEYKRLILASVISNELENFQVDRKKIQIGHWSDEQWDVIRQAQEYINQYKGNIKFVQCYDYDISSVKKIIHTLSKQGVEIFLYDTFKSSDLSVSNSWGNMVEDSKVLFQAANRENVAVIATMQLAISTLNTRYLTSQCLSTAKGVKEVCSDIILFRKLWDDERTGETYDVKGHYFKKENGIYLKEKQELITIPDKKYTVFFLDKTRSGTSDIQLLYKTDLRYNTWKELGYCKSHQL